MSKFTTEVRYICETYAGYSESKGYDKVDDIIESARGYIFSKDYPIFNNEYRQTLEHKILEHYYTREIGFESVGLWKLKLNAKMKEIMPYYNKLYLSELLEFDPFHDTDIETTHLRTEEGQNERSDTTNSEGTDTQTLGTNKLETRNLTTQDTGSNSNTNRYSDTPQGGLDGMTNIENNMYLTNATIDNGTNNNTNTQTGTVNEANTGTVTNEKENETTLNSNGNFNTEENYTETVKGKRGSYTYSYLLKEYRDTFLNIDMMIIEELKDLFMLIWE